MVVPPARSWELRASAASRYLHHQPVTQYVCSRQIHSITREISFTCNRRHPMIVRNKRLVSVTNEHGRHASRVAPSCLPPSAGTVCQAVSRRSTRSHQRHLIFRQSGHTIAPFILQSKTRPLSTIPLSGKDKHRRSLQRQLTFSHSLFDDSTSTMKLSAAISAAAIAAVATAESGAYE